MSDDAATRNFASPPMTSRNRDLIAACRRELPLISLVLLLTAVAAALRLPYLTQLPPGLHGDEGWTGIDVRRIHDQGWIGVYVRSALGQPAGPLYIVAAMTWIGGVTETSIRSAMATLGVLTIPAAFGAFALMFNRRVGLLAATLLAVSAWHLHLSRSAFLVTAWPLAEMLAIICLFAALRTGRWSLYAAAGLAVGLGFYSYNAYPVFAFGLGLFGVVLLVRHRERLRSRVPKLLLVALLAAIVAIPLIRYAADDSNDYLSHHRFVSTFETRDWKDGSTGERIGIVARKGRHYVVQVTWRASPDFVDGSGTSPLLDPVSVGLLALGIIVAVRRWRDDASLLLLIMLAVIPVSAISTMDGGARRTLGITPFIAAAGALGIDAVLSQLESSAASTRRAAYGFVAIALIAVGALNMHAYFFTFRESNAARFTYTPEITETADWMDANIAPDHLVYFYSSQWSFRYETVRFLAPELTGQDRSTQFSPEAKAYEKQFGTVPLLTDRPANVVYVFLSPYLGKADEIAKIYPGGTTAHGPMHDGAPSFRAYILNVVPPAVPSPVAVSP